jgi:protein-S-isoprenylcysteine O-methyltransferase Ste14
VVLPPTPLARAYVVGGAIVFVVALAFGAWRFVALGVDPGVGALGPGLVINTLLFGAFGLHHSLLAREPIKAWVSARVSPPLERPTYVWVASVLFIATCLAWQPIAGTIYRLDGPWVFAAAAIQLTGGALTLDAARRIDVLVLSGLKPEPAQTDDLVAAGTYRFVRHPIYLGWVLLVWGDTVMTTGRLAFAAISTVYLVVAVPFEERSLRRRFASYAAYAQQVRWRILPGLY